MTNYERPLPNDPAWLRAAFADLGLREIPGRQHEERVLDMFRAAGHPEVVDDETAWCAAAVGNWLHKGGAKNSGSLMARSYEKYGRKLDKYKPLPRGAILVWPRGKPPQGHVNILLYDDGKVLTCIGGNQGNAVSIVHYAKDELVCAVWPTEVPLVNNQLEFPDDVPLPRERPVDVNDEPLPQEWRPGQDRDEDTRPWYKRVFNYILGGGSLPFVGGAGYGLSGIKDPIIWLIIAGFVLCMVVLVFLGVLIWKKHMEPQR